MTSTASTKGKRKKSPDSERFEPSAFSLKEAAKNADVLSWISILIFGFGTFARRQFVKGIVFLASEVAIFAFLFTIGAEYLPKIVTLGTETQHCVKVDGFPECTAGDSSVEILLYSVMSIAAVVLLVYVATLSLRSAYKAQSIVAKGKRPVNFIEDVASLFDRNAHVGLMSLPTAGIVVFSILPLIFMISMAFTNYDSKHVPLFQWVGLTNFFKIFSTSSGAINAATFIEVLVWTLVWAFFATFLNFFFGMFIAMIINRRTTVLKNLWRTCFSLTIAVPQFVSLLIMHSMLQHDGAINRLLHSLGWIGDPLPFFEDATWARVTVILINLWVGIPYTIMQITGILQNVPAELYEAAQLDGAGWWQRFMNVTMPYIFFVMTPYLITTFTGNVNNFNVIYLLSGGAPTEVGSSAGKTDLLITWLYKLTVDKDNYCMGAVIGIMTFIVLAVVALITYRNSGSYKNEEGFR